MEEDGATNLVPGLLQDASLMQGPAAEQGG